jgi:hypothetical protein
MTLIIQKPTGAKLNLAQTYVGIDDPDAAVYVAAVEAADGEALETATKVAVHSFVKGCKNDGIWPAIKASCILAGARTLAGALVPLAGTAPTNNNFVSGDYNRETGLVGDGSTKYLNSNRAGNADPQNSAHAAVYVTTVNTGIKWYAGSNNTDTGSSNFFSRDAGTEFRSRNSTIGIVRASTNVAGLIGLSRGSSASYETRANMANLTATQTSQTPSSANWGIYLSLGYAPAAAHSNARLAFYSIGENLNLALLDARVTTLINAFAAAIP